jgi:hypothetical protein
MPDASIDNQLAQVRQEPYIVGANEAKNPKVVFPNEGQPLGRPYRVVNGVIRPPRLPELWNRLHQGSNAGHIGGCRLAKHSSSLQVRLHHLLPYLPSRINTTFVPSS